MRCVFLLKNGIGLGHHRRALILADALVAIDRSVEVVLIAQAGRIDHLERSQHTVINLPNLYRLPSNTAQAFCWRFLDALLAELEPELVVEDTHPDAGYLSLPSIALVPRVLVLRPLEPSAFDRHRREGVLARYDRVIVLQERESFVGAQPLASVRALLSLDRRFVFTGPVFEQASDASVRAARARHAASGEKLVVVTAGGGGEHHSEGYCERLYRAAAELAARWSNREVHFLVVLGPNFSGAAPPPAPNLRVERFVRDLPALLRGADAVILRPGYNAMHESLAGGAAVLAVPSVSFGENQRAWCERLAARGLVSIASIETLEERLDAALADAKPRRALPDRTGEAAVELLRAEREARAGSRPRRLLACTADQRGRALSAQLEESGHRCTPMDRPHRALPLEALPLWEGRPLPVERGTQLGVSREELLALGVPVVELATVAVERRRWLALLERASNVYLDLGALELDAVLEAGRKLAAFLAERSLVTTTLEEEAGRETGALLFAERFEPMYFGTVEVS